jgi:hypothetical protein
MIVLPDSLARLTNQSPRVLYAKFVLVLAAALRAARAFTASQHADYARGEALTREAYIAEYEQYRADLMDDRDGVGLNFLFLGVFMAGIFTIYELGGYALARVSLTLVRPGAQQPSLGGGDATAREPAAH